MNEACADGSPFGQFLFGAFGVPRDDIRGGRHGGRPRPDRRRDPHGHSRHERMDPERMDRARMDRARMGRERMGRERMGRERMDMAGGPGRPGGRGAGPGDWFGDLPVGDLSWLFGGPGPGGFRPPGRRGPGGPFGGPGRRRRPRAGRGDVRAAILALLAEEPRNGYQIIQEISERSRGVWRPSPGSVYPALSQLEDEGLEVAAQEGSRRSFRLTDDGRAYVDAHPNEVNAPWEAMADAHDQQADRNPGAAEFTELMGQTGFAAVQVLRAGTPEQVEQARQLLEETRRRLYRILAEDDADGANDDDGDDPADD